MTKRLYRSRNNVMVAGVLAGVAEYFDHDPTLWRLAFVLALVLTGIFPFVLIYILACIVMPVAPDITFTEVTNDTEPKHEG